MVGEGTNERPPRGETTGSDERASQRLTGQVMVFDLREEVRQLKDEDPWTDGMRNGKTLAKEGGLSVTLTALKAGTSMTAEHVDGHLTVQVVHGRISLRAAGASARMNAGFVAVVEPGLHWDIVAEEESELLLTIALPPGARHEAAE